MITITKKENLLYIFYNHELYRKSMIIANFHLILFLFSAWYIILFYENYIVFIYSEFFIFILYFISYKICPIFSKIKIILYEDKFEVIKRKNSSSYLFSDIKKIEYHERIKAKKEDLFYIEIKKENNKTYKCVKGRMQKDIMEIYKILKNNFENWRIKNAKNDN